MKVFRAHGGHAPPKRMRRARRFRTAVAVAALFGLLGAATPASANPGVPSPVFDQNSVDWDLVLNRTSGQYGVDFTQRANDGFMVIDIEVADRSCHVADYNDSCRLGADENLYSAVFQRNTDHRAWRQLRDMPEARFRQEHSRALSEHMRLIDFEAYTYFGGSSLEERYAAVWVENRENLFSPFGSLTFDRTESVFAEIVRAQRNAGNMAIDVEEYHVPGCEVCFAAIFVENREGLKWQIAWSQSGAQFSDKFDRYKADGYRPLAVSSQARWDCDRIAGCGGGESEAYNLYAGIWVENRSGRGWAERRDMTQAVLSSRRTEYTAAGYRPIAIEAYKWSPADDRTDFEDGYHSHYWHRNHYVPRYAAIWRQNT